MTELQKNYTALIHPVYTYIVPISQHIFADGNVPRFPDPRDFKIAIVDEPDGIKLRVEFLSPALAHVCVDVRILVAIGVDSWPSTTDFPNRIPLGHVDCLLYHKAAQTVRLGKGVFTAFKVN